MICIPGTHPLHNGLVRCAKRAPGPAAALVAWSWSGWVPGPGGVVPLGVGQVKGWPAADGTDAEPVLPAHMRAGAVMVATGRAFAMIAIGADVVLQPEPLPTVTV